MRVVVFSDIHANLEALGAFLRHCSGRNVDRYICLGDVVGYGPDPNGCIDRLRNLSHAVFILGNHDASVLGAPMRAGAATRKAIAWTRKRLSDENYFFLKEMSETIRWNDTLFCHSNPYKPRNWYYVSEKSSISKSFARSKTKLLFLGHTHVPVAITRRNFFCVYIRSPRNGTVVPMSSVNRQIFNCGSIGQPRDGDARGAYLIYDTKRKVVEFYRFDYDFHRTKEKIFSSGLPEEFGRRLIKGL